MAASVSTVAEPRAATTARWLSRGFWAIADQGLFALSNFALNVLLARWLPQEEYGAFAVAYSVFLLLGAFHTAILTEPMMVFGAGKYAEGIRRYFGILISRHWKITALISLFLSLSALVFWRQGSQNVAQALGGLAVASPFLLFVWLLRRAFYVQLQPQWAATGGGLYMALMVAGMYGLSRMQLISPFSALVVMGAASAIASLWLIPLLRPQGQLASSYPTSSMVLADHWAYGKWSIATTGLMWASGNIYYVFLPAWVGLEGSAGLRAVMNLIMPILHANAAISTLLVPEFVKIWKDKGKMGLQRIVRRALLLFGIGPLLYWCFLVVYRYQLMTAFYSGRYTEYGNLLLITGLIPLLGGVVAVLGGALRAIERPDQVFWCYVISSLVTVTLGLWLLMANGVVGAGVGLLSSSLATAVAMVWFFMQQNQQIQGTLE